MTSRRPWCAAAAAVAAVSLAGCIQLSTSSDDAGTSSSTTTTTTTAADGATVVTTTTGGTATGGGCITTTNAGATLCSSISVCPGVTLDRDAFPDCGFRISGEALDLECDCNGELCPIGVPASCTQLSQLFTDQQSEAVVCVQVSEGRCTSTAPVSTTSPNCNTTCRDSCNGAPDCLQACGC